MEKERHLYRLFCKSCHHTYQYEGEWHEVEICPICGRYALFNEFVDEVADIAKR